MAPLSYGGLTLSLAERRRVSVVRITSKNVFVVVGAALFFGFLFGYDPVPDRPVVGRTLAVAVLMAFYWLTEALPMSATALIPVVAFPMMGVLNASEVAPLYINNIMFLFIGGFLLAAGMERWELHRRIALRIIISVGKSPALLLFGFMFGSWVLSGWVSNTATTLMMTPIVMALALKFEEKGGEAVMPLTIALLLGIAYASSVGGMATLIGTAPNLSLARIFSQTFPDAPEITFVKWMTFALPTSAVLFVVIYFYLRRVVLGRRKFDIDSEVLRGEYASLGRPVVRGEDGILDVHRVHRAHRHSSRRRYRRYRDTRMGVADRRGRVRSRRHRVDRSGHVPLPGSGPGEGGGYSRRRRGQSSAVGHHYTVGRRIRARAGVSGVRTVRVSRPTTRGIAAHSSPCCCSLLFVH